MDPPSYLLDKSFLVALADVDDPNHDEAKELYRGLIDDFVAQRCLLVARADHLAQVDSQQLFAATDKLHVARQHRNAAEKMVETFGIEMDLAITLVLVRRYKLRKVATFDDRFAGYDVTLIEPVASPASDGEPVEN
jgi:predicted nucleic acid-binding protein